MSLDILFLLNHLLKNGKLIYFSWYKNGKVHRDENGKTLPACICDNGNKFWYQNDKLHRNDFDEQGKVLPFCEWGDEAHV